VPVRADVLTVIDYTKPSSKPRLWVFDLNHSRVLFEELVAHGKNRGRNRAVQFSNEPGSLMSSHRNLRGGALLLAYFPEKSWLQTSRIAVPSGKNPAIHTRA
jgi:L,D-transpeptidase catalytic domain